MTANARFLIDYYNWCLAASAREFQFGFPLLSKVRGTSALKLIAFAKSLPERERAVLCSGLVKRFFRNIESSGQLSVSESERGLVQRYLDSDKQVLSGKVRGILAYSSPEEELVLTKLENGELGSPKRSEIRKLVLKRLNSFFGTRSTGKHDLLEYRIKQRNWSLRTIIDFGRRDSQISYAHRLSKVEGEITLPPIHICGWMGLSGETIWNVYSGEDTALVADGICLLIEFFHAEWRNIFPE